MSLQAVLNQAVALHQKGQLGDAERLYRQVLAGESANGHAWYLFAMLRLQQGDSAEALDAVERSLKRDTNFVQALHLRGVLLQGMGRPGDALASFDSVVAKKPDHAEAWYNRGVTLNELDRAADAVAAFDKALALRPDNAQAWSNRGEALKTLGQSDAALESYDRAARLQPGSAEIWYNRAILLEETGRLDEAVAAFDKAVAARSGYAEAWNNRGSALQALKRHEEALISYDFALRAQPDYAEAWNNRGIALRALDRDADALASYDRALALRPDYATAHYHRGVTLSDMQRLEEAVASYDRALDLGGETSQLQNSRAIALWHTRHLDQAMASFDRALALKPDNADALRNRGAILWDVFGRYDDALRDHEAAMMLDPGHDYLRGDVLHLQMQAADWQDYAHEMAALENGVRAGAKIARPFLYQALSQSPADLRACSTLYAADLYPFTPAFAPGPWRGHDRIRLGYVSGEFRSQATAVLTAGLYEAHDKDRFELVAFDNDQGDASPYRARLEAGFDRFVDISRMNHAQAAQAVRDREIDILISLNGYFGRHRMEIFAQRPAPVQVNYLGFPATLGADYIDYIVADRFVIPEDEKRHYAEQVVWLPDTYQVNDSKRRIASAAPSRADCGLPETGFVFCNFNQAYKFTPPLFAIWMRILKAVDGSVLWLLQDPRISALEDNLKREAERHGVAGARLIFAPYLGTQEHLARLALGDLFLDSVPYNAHTTASDALWAGLPLLTVRGHAFAGRVAASLLHALDMPELVTENLAEFEALAVTLAREPARLAALRRTLADNRLTKPLFDTARFTHHIEAAYERMWDIAQRGEKPQSFSIPPID